MCGFTACSGKNGGSDTKTDADLTKVGEYTANNTEYVIGATGTLTGDASSYGNSVRNGAQLAVDEINAAGGLNGVNFKFDMKDDKAGAVEAGQGFTSLLEGGMQVSLGAVTSASCEAFGTAAAEYGIFFMTPPLPQLLLSRPATPLSASASAIPTRAHLPLRSLPRSIRRSALSTIPPTLIRRASTMHSRQR